MKELPGSYAIVIVTYNRLHMLRQCLEHAVFQTLPPNAVVVVDNASTDGTGQYLDELKKGSTFKAKQDVKLLIYHERENAGGAGGFHDGMKLAIKYTDAQWILVIDDDAILDYDCCEKMDPQNLSDVSAEIDGKPVLAKACSVYYKGELELSHRKDAGGTVAAQRYEDASFYCTSTSFCGSMFHRTLIERIGYPRKDYFIWFDDTEYSMRVVEHSKIQVITGAGLQHGDPDAPDRRAVVDWRYYYGTRNQLDMLRRHKKIWKLFGFACTVRLIIMLRNIRRLMHITNPDAAKTDLEEKRIFADGLRDGLRGNLGKNPDWLPGNSKKA